MTLTWEPDNDSSDEGLRMKSTSVEVDRNSITIIVSQSIEADWKWTYHLEFDGIVEPDVRVDGEEEIKRIAVDGAIDEVRKLLARLEACR